MKKAILPIFIVLAAGLSSCQKFYSCSCTTTITFDGRDPHESHQVYGIGQKTSKKQATAICASTATQLNEHLQQQLADPNVSSQSSAECALK